LLSLYRSGVSGDFLTHRRKSVNFKPETPIHLNCCLLCLYSYYIHQQHLPLFN
jgi:hypothetical protein